MDNEDCFAWEETYSKDGRAIECSQLKTQEEIDNLGLAQEVVDALGFDVVSKCKKQACLIESDFINEVADLFLESPDARNPEFDHNSDSFNSEAECITKKCEGDHCDNREKQCCGTVPGRRTYKTSSDKGESRECCGETVYLSTMMQCCADETVAAFGACLA